MMAFAYIVCAFVFIGAAAARAAARIHATDAELSRLVSSTEGKNCIFDIAVHVFCFPSIFWALFFVIFGVMSNCFK